MKIDEKDILQQHPIKMPSSAWAAVAQWLGSNHTER